MIKKSRAKKIIDGFGKQSVLVVGDLIMDRFIWGVVARISPEAPVPVVEVEREEDRPGGAGNVIFNLIDLEAKVFAGGIAGMDSVGDRLVRNFEYRGINVEGVLLDPARPTSLKTRVIASHQHVVRYDKEFKTPISHEFESRLLAVLRAVLPQANAVILSDYGKGLITEKLAAWIGAQARKFGKPIFVDPKPENFKLYKKVTCVTPNLSEAFLGMGELPKAMDEAVELMGRRIVKSLKVPELIITRGSQGMSVFAPNGSRGERCVHIAAQSKEVYDVTGAGDTVVAVYALARISGANPFEAAQLANTAAGLVVGKIGTATITRKELIEAL